MRRYLLLGAIALMTTAPVTASAFTAENGVSVTATANGFTVDGGNGFGARGMWCAAADYAIRQAGAAAGQRLYVANQSGNRNRVTFTLTRGDLEPSAVVSIGASISRPGAYLRVGHAYRFCADPKLNPGR